MSQVDWTGEDLEKYNFAVKPGSPDYDEQVCEFTLEQHIQQSKAFRAWHWDRYGVTGELDERFFEMADDDIAQMEEELNNRGFNEAFDQASDEDVIYTARTWLINLTANGNEDARKLGFDDAFIDDFRAKLDAMEKAVENEKKAIFNAEKDRINRASAEFLKRLGPTSKPFLSHGPKPQGPGDLN
ncbi:MAG TPA: hypothetical protein PKA82_18280 [Pyrinomonadaceae bacterium]|nr:hypothetical protein [Pyrinomonadaceae bacterium]